MEKFGSVIGEFMIAGNIRVLLARTLIKVILDNL